MPRPSKRMLWLLLMVAGGIYLVWSTSGLRQPADVEQRNGRTETAPAGRPAATPKPSVSPQPREGTFILPGAGSVTHNSVVSISGYGFPPGETISVIFRDKEVGTAIADESGVFSGVNVEIGTDLAPGRYPIRAVGTTVMAETTVEIVPGMPYVVPSSYSGKPGDHISLNGGGFRPGESIGVYLDTLAGSPLVEVTGGETGEVAVENLAVPYAAEGDHAFIVMGQESRALARVPFSVMGFYPWVTLSTYNTPPQRPIGFVGEDWAPGEQVLVFISDGTDDLGEPVAVARADETGHVETEGLFSLPLGLRGEVTLLFRGQTTGKVVDATVTVEPFSPQIQLTTYAGQPNTEVAFIGEGFARGERIDVYLGAEQVAQPVSTFVADENGAFNTAGAFRIPFGTPEGEQTITVIGETSRVPIAVEFAVLPLTPSLTLTTYAGRPGDTVAVSGSGFAAGERLRLYVGEPQDGREVGTITAGPDGAFQDVGAFAIPPATQPGKLSITAVGETSLTPAVAEFEVLPPQAWGSLSAYAGPPGTAITFSGNGFAPGEIVHVYAGDDRGEPALSATAGSDGSFLEAGPYVVPAGATGSIGFSMVGQTSQAEVKLDFTVAAPGGEVAAPEPTTAQPPSP